MTLFRVHYSITTLRGIERQHADVSADNADAAAAQVTARFKPRPIFIAKVKRVKEAAHG
jgi:uncharacterized membrane protein